MGGLWPGANPAASKQTARGSTGTRCQRVGGSELVPSLALFKHIYTANAPELPDRTWVCFRYVLPELPGRWMPCRGLRGQDPLWIRYL